MLKGMAAFVLALMAVLGAIVVALELLGWNVLREPVSRVVTISTGRVVTIQGDLDVDLGLTPRISATDVQLANPSWVDAGQPMLRAQRVEIDLHLPDLLRGRVVLPRVCWTTRKRRWCDGRTARPAGISAPAKRTNPAPRLPRHASAN